MRHKSSAFNIRDNGKTRLARGFTMLEILIAITIFSMIGMSAYTVLSSTIMSSTRAQKDSDTFLRLHRVMQVMQQDLHQLRDRPIRDEIRSYPALAAGNGLPDEGATVMAFTRAGYSNPLLLRRSELLRVEYRLEPTSEEFIDAQALADAEGEGLDDTNLSLMRYYWSSIDHTENDKPQSQLLLHNVSKVELQLQDEDGNWTGDWPLPTPANPSAAAAPAPALPVSVELTAHLNDGVSIRRLVYLK